MDNPTQILKDILLDQQLLGEGYVVIPFLNENEISDLTSYFRENHTNAPKGLYATAHVSDTEFRNKMNDKIYAVFQRANELAFGEEVLALGGTFMVKTPGPEGRLIPHQDWSIVDENEFRSFNIWVPLVDTNESNGGLQVLENSHTMVDVYRGPNTPSAFDQVYDEVWPKMKTLEVPAGHAVVYDHRLLHASEENKTTEDRLVVVYGIIPKKAEMRYYYVNGTKVAEYKCHPDFFMYGNPASGPGNLEKLQEFEYTFPKVASSKPKPTKTEKVQERKPILVRIKDWFR